MTTATQPKPNPVPAVLVYGMPTGSGLRQASWFRAEDKEAVKAAAKALKFSVIELQTEADKALTTGIDEGVLKGSGRMILGSVSAEVYRRIEEHVRKTAGAPDPSKAEDVAAITTKSAKGASAAPRPSRRPSPRRRYQNPFQNKTRTLARRVRARRNRPVLPQLRRRPPSRTAPPPENPYGSAPGSWLPTGTRNANLRASGSRPSSASKPANTSSSGSTARDIRRSRAGPRTSPCRIPSSASRASELAEKSILANSMGRPAGRPSSFPAHARKPAAPTPPNLWSQKP